MKLVELTPTSSSSDAKPDAKFAIGDQVQLNSGGPVMTVRKATRSSAQVDWFDAQDDLQTASFDPRMLQAHDD